MAFLTSDGSIHTIGKFFEEDGIMFSNRSYEQRYYCDYDWLKYNNFWYKETIGKDNEDEYVENLKMVAAYQGIDGNLVDYLLHNGFSLDEIEDYIYEF